MNEPSGVQNDLRKLRGVLAFAQRLFAWIVYDEVIHDSNLARWAIASSAQVNARLSNIDALLSHGVDNNTMVRLHQAGLTDAQLEFKLSIFDWLIYSRRTLRTFLKWLNNMLEGLAFTFPALEQVKEWSEEIELVVTSQPHVPRPPREILNLRAEE